jgi:hypothetical protein
MRNENEKIELHLPEHVLQNVPKQLMVLKLWMYCYSANKIHIPHILLFWLQKKVFHSELIHLFL